jgi:tRNA wybutosine-synthesizing protein 2
MKIAKHSQPSRVLAIELNPLAYHFLRENIRLNRVEDIVEPVLGDCAQSAPVNEADQVVMGIVLVLTVIS